MMLDKKDFPLIETGVDTLEANVRILLSNCPHIRYDNSGEKTGLRGLPDLIGTLVLTFRGMEIRIEELKKNGTKN